MTPLSYRLHGIDLVSFEYQAPSWSRPRRVIGIRQDTKKREEAKTLSLFSEHECWKHYRFSTLVTDLTLPTQVVWRTYRGRADCENRIKELKYDFGADSFCMKEFWATEACMNRVMTAYNWMSLFRQAALRSTVGKVPPKQIQHTLNTLRYKLFAKAAYISKASRKNPLNMVMDVKQRTWFEGVWDRSKNFDKPVTFSPVFDP
ncbi:MAG: transposase [Betaproteobacteria bacterium]